MTSGVCECGCGSTTEVWKVTDRRRGRIKGEHKRFVRGHNGRLPGVDYTLARSCSSCGVSIGRKNTKGMCPRCFCAMVGRSNAKPKPDCLNCGKPVPQVVQKYCCRACYEEHHVTPKGADHWSWKGNAVGHWGARNRAQKVLPPRPCEVCGTESVHRHHVDRNIHNNDPSNIRFLCASHHKKLHIEEDGLKGAAGVKGPRGPRRKKVAT